MGIQSVLEVGLRLGIGPRLFADARTRLLVQRLGLSPGVLRTAIRRRRARATWLCDVTASEPIAWRAKASLPARLRLGGDHEPAVPATPELAEPRIHWLDETL
ncbi:MAG: hypothetical protein IT318_00265 [Anaerolineales bacterium]|nr:hypothetical protein [Anaerolineales bacterium]